MIYLDANFFIFSNFDTGTKGDNARKILSDVIGGKDAVTSALSLDEVMWVLTKNNRKETIRSVIEEVYSVPNLSVKDVPSTTPLRALDFMEKYGLRPRDAFHTAMMDSLKIEEIVSDDKDFDEVGWIKRIAL